MRSLLIVALLGVVVACGSSGTNPVQLLTYAPDTCHPAPAAGLLVVDQQYGTALADSSWGPLMPVAWPAGYTARSTGGEIEVVAPDGHLVAVTGRRYELIGVAVDVGGTRALGACGAFPR
jgi:hypothetical protein